MFAVNTKKTNIIFPFVHFIKILEPGQLEFEKPSYVAKENCGLFSIPVIRTGGADGLVTTRWRTINMSAERNTHYFAEEHKLYFEHGETSQPIELEINDYCVSKKMLKK